MVLLQKNTEQYAFTYLRPLSNVWNMLKDLLDLLVRLLVRMQHNRPARFLIIGIFNSAFGLLVYSLVILLSAPVWFALMTGMCTGIVFNFFTTSGFVFRDTSTQRVPRFVFCYLLIYAVNYGLINALIRWVDSAIIAQALLTPLIAGLSYFLMARFVFKDSAKTT